MNAEADFLEEAIDFLRQALTDYRNERPKFAVLHAGMAVELLLKARLVKINPGAVLEKVDNPRCKTTVGMNNILPRLETFGIVLEESDCELVRQIAAWRNDVAHRKLLARKEDVLEKLAAAYKFFTRFQQKHFSIDVRRQLTEEEYGRFKRLLKDRDRLVEEAQEAAREASKGRAASLETYHCEECWGALNTVARVDSMLKCFLCDKIFPRFCDRCRTAVSLAITTDDPDAFLCEECADKLTQP